MSPDEVRNGITTISINDHRRLILALRQYIYSSDLAEECLQAAYVEALERANEIERPDRLESWLYTVAKRYAIKYLNEYHELLRFCDLHQSYVSDDPYEQAMLKILAADVFCHVLNQFPMHYAEILRLRYFERLTFSQIGKRLNIPTDTVRKAHWRILHLLKKFCIG